MNKRLLMFLISMFVAAIVISGCGSDNNDENENNNDNDTNTEENENNNENNEENENNENNEDEEVSAIDEDKFGNENEDNDENEDEEDGAESSIAISESAFADLIEYKIGRASCRERVKLYEVTIAYRRKESTVE